MAGPSVCFNSLLSSSSTLNCRITAPECEMSLAKDAMHRPQMAQLRYLLHSTTESESLNEMQGTQDAMRKTCISRDMGLN